MEIKLRKLGQGEKVDEAILSMNRAAEDAASEKLKLDLERAHIDMRPGAYLSYVWVNTIFTAVKTTKYIFHFIGHDVRFCLNILIVQV